MRIVPAALAEALRNLIKQCGMHDFSLGDLVYPLDARCVERQKEQIHQLTVERDSLITSLAAATVLILKYRKQIAKYEADLGIEI